MIPLEVLLLNKVVLAILGFLVMWIYIDMFSSVKVSGYASWRNNILRFDNLTKE